MAVLSHRSRTEWSNATERDFAQADLQRPIKSLFGDMKEKNHDTLRSNKEHHLQLPRSQMKWRVILPNPAGDGGFQGTSLPTCHIIFCVASSQAGRPGAGLAGRQAVGAWAALGMHPLAAEASCAAKDQHLPCTQTAWNEP